MKKHALAAFSVAALLFAGCSSAGTTSTADGEVSNTAHVATDDGEISATVTKKDGKITAVEIDETTADGDSKKELGSDYGLAKASSIGKDWDEQIKYLENFIVENGVDAVKLDADGYAENEDVKSGCTINLSKIMEAVDEANAE